jgi:hypothetical protein
VKALDLDLSADDLCERCGNACPRPAVDDAWLCAPCAAMQPRALRWRPSPVTADRDQLSEVRGLMLGLACCVVAWVLLVGAFYGLAWIC